MHNQGTAPETYPSDTRHYIRELADVDLLTARAATDLQLKFLNPMGVEAIDAARLAEARQAIAAGAFGSGAPPWAELTDDERAGMALTALHWLRAAREIGLAR